MIQKHSLTLDSRPAVTPLDLVKRGIQSVLNRLGYQVLQCPAPHSYERHIRELLLGLDVNCVIDVGAHEGEFYRLLRQAGYTGAIVSFEPLPESFIELRREAAGDPKWRGYNLALGTETGRKAINVPDSTGFTSFLRPNAYCEERFPHARWEGRTVDVQVERLEALYPQVVDGIARPRVFLKMDTQGWDIRVLEGAGAALPDVVMLQSEVSVIPIYDGMSSIVESIAYYNALGFEFTNLFPVTFDAEGIRVVEYDCVMRRRIARNPAMTL
jgi:FkbM family methyltransferase